MIIRRLSIFSLSVALLALGVSAEALTAKEKVEKEVTVQQADGTSVTKRVPIDGVTPGEIVVYSVDYFNDSAEPATDLVLNIEVPTHVRYLEGTADREGAVVKYSVDFGASYAERDALVLPAVGGGTRPAASDDITNIQWRIAGPVPASTEGAVAFKGRLK